MQQFEKVEIRKPESSVFDHSHGVQGTAQMGKVIPFLCREVVPGQVVNFDVEFFARTQPLIAPIMSRMDTVVEFFYCPNDIIMDDWKKFITKEKVGGLDINHPKFVDTHNNWANSGYFGPSGLFAGLGVPVTQAVVGNGNAFPSFSQLPWRAYWHIVNNYYRNQKIQAEHPFPKDSVDMSAQDISDIEVPVIGNDVMGTLFKRNWRKDYFTSILPTAQEGEPVNLISDENTQVTGVPKFDVKSEDPRFAKIYPGSTGRGGNLVDDVVPPNDLSVESGLTAEIEVTMRDFRYAQAVQRFMERLMLVGSRYWEQILVKFGFKPSFAKLEIPEFLGGSKFPVMISEIQKTAEDEVTNSKPIGGLAGRGVSAGRSNRIYRRFEDYGWLIGIVSFVPRATYYQGLHRQFTRFDPDDYINPLFARIGEQEVSTQELYVGTNVATNALLLGYQERYGEYKYIPDRLFGELTSSLSYWALSRKFNDYPGLNADLIDIDEADVQEIWGVANVDPIIFSAYINMKSVLPLPRWSTPV